MKIGILTFQASHNCGSMLQAYALQYVISKKLGYDCELINYANSASRNMYGLFDLRINRNFIRENWQHLLNLNAYRASIKEYNDFSKSHLVLSEYVTTIQGLKEVSKKYDVVIAGGDQVWNVRCPDAGKEFYLNFSNDVKKIAYSPSLGGNNILTKADNLEVYKELLGDFSSLSVREPNGKKWLEELTGRAVEIVADPTLLLSPEEWSTLLPIYEIKEDYIFNYAFYHNRPETNRILQSISAKLGMPIYVLDYKKHAVCKLDKFGIKRFAHTGPLAFLGLMKNAKLVMTQSFHGTLFSALFNRNFWSYNWVETHNPDDDRATAILAQLGLEDRYKMIDDLEDYPDILSPIDYTLVNERIEDMRIKGMDYLKKSLE